MTEEQLNDDDLELAMIDGLNVPLFHNELSPEDILIFFQKTLPQFIKERPGRGNKSVKYVEGWYVKQVLNLATKFRWHNHINGHTITKDEVIVWGSVTIELDGKPYTQSSFGESQVHYYKCDKIKSVQIACQKDKSACKLHTCEQTISIGDDLKAAHTDMIKKAANIWGIAMDIYSNRNGE